MGAEVISEDICAQGLHEVLFQMDQVLSHRPLVTSIYSLYHTI